MKMSVLFVVVFFLSCHVSAAEFPGIDALMTAEEKQAAGLHKLSETEIRALNYWLIKYTIVEASVTPVSASDVDTNRHIGIISNIDGQFSGWTGKTIFRLNNGQVWKQRLPGRWRYEANSPAAKITKNWLGYYILEVDGKKKIGVSKVKKE